MKMLITSALFLGAAYCTAAYSLELHSYKDNATTRDYSQATVEKTWASDQPACIKNGAKLVGVNAAFKKRGLGYRDCSSSDAAKLMQRKAGYTVTVFKLAYLPKPLFDQVTGK